MPVKANTIGASRVVGQRLFFQSPAGAGKPGTGAGKTEDLHRSLAFPEKEKGIKS